MLIRTEINVQTLCEFPQLLLLPVEKGAPIVNGQKEQPTEFGADQKAGVRRGQSPRVWASWVSSGGPSGVWQVSWPHYVARRSGI
jgi:hypothetical protein